MPIVPTNLSANETLHTQEEALNDVISLSSGNVQAWNTPATLNLSLNISTFDIIEYYYDNLIGTTPNDQGAANTIVNTMDTGNLRSGGNTVQALHDEAWDRTDVSNYYPDPTKYTGTPVWQGE